MAQAREPLFQPIDPATTAAIASREGSITPGVLQDATPSQILIEQATAELRHTFIALQALAQPQDGVTTPDLSLSSPNVAKTDILTEYNALVEQYKGFIMQYPGLELYRLDHYENKSGNKVTRYEIDVVPLTPEPALALAAIHSSKTSTPSTSSRTSARSKEVTPSYILHPIEVYNIKRAIQELRESQDSRSILVDIFIRGANGAIQMEYNRPEVHTIVLFKQKTNDNIVVIDPNNSDFSKHIAFNKAIIFGPTSTAEFIVPKGTCIKIYTTPQGKTTGTEPNMYRNCTNIAVVLAFGLQQHDADINILKSLDIVTEVTNHTSTNAALFFSSEQSVARMRQSSDDQARKVIAEQIKCIHEQLKMVTTIFDTTSMSDCLALYLRAFQQADIDGYDKDFKLANKLSEVYTSTWTMIQAQLQEQIKASAEKFSSLALSLAQDTPLCGATEQTSEGE